MKTHNSFRRVSLVAIGAAVITIAAGLRWSPSASASPSRRSAPATILDTLVRLERGALDRWIRLDPDGYLGIYSRDATYFDPTTETRIDGLSALRERIEPIRRMKSPFKDPRYEMIAPKVQRFGNAAILTFNLVNYAKMGDRPEGVINRWNSTEVYALQHGKWTLVHSHWSYTKPEPRQEEGWSSNKSRKRHKSAAAQDR